MKQVRTANISDGAGTMTFAYTNGNFVVLDQTDYNAAFIVQTNPRLHQKQSEMYVQYTFHPCCRLSVWKLECTYWRYFPHIGQNV
jgi:hypothetical protein